MGKIQRRFTKMEKKQDVIVVFVIIGDSKCADNVQRQMVTETVLLVLQSIEEHRHILLKYVHYLLFVLDLLVAIASECNKNAIFEKDKSFKLKLFLPIFKK